MKNTFSNENETKALLSKFILNSKILSMNQKCREFEFEFSKFQGCKESILFNSGGSANLAMIQSLLNLGRLKIGDKIGFSALTWSTNVMPIIQLGLVPVAIDCNLNKLNVTSKELKDSIIKNKIKGFFSTNVLGLTGDLLKIKEICDENNIVYFEDNCETLGSEISNKKAGNFGVCSSFSFFVAHHMSTIEGGMVCTNDLELADMLRIVRANGWDRNLNIKSQIKLRKTHNIKSAFEAKYTFYDLGYNLRPTEITGFLGLEQLKHLPNNIKKRNENYNLIHSIYNKNDDFIKIDSSHMDYVSSFAFPFICKEKNREHYLSEFSGAGIEIRPIISGNMQNQPFYKKYVKKLIDLPNTTFIHENGFYCGNYPELSDMDLELISISITKD